MAHPFEVLYVVVRNGSDKRIYTKEGQARSRVTTSVDQTIDRFIHDVELWTVGHDGWELTFSAKAGEHYSKISWKTAIPGNKTRDARRAQAELDYEESIARREYEKLKARFEGAS